MHPVPEVCTRFPFPPVPSCSRSVYTLREQEASFCITLLKSVPYLQEVLVARVANQLLVARRVDGQDLGPNGDKQRPKLAGRGLQQLQDVREDAYRERQVHCPRAQVEKSAQQVQSPQSVCLR